jgi:hypothetical protein
MYDPFCQDLSATEMRRLVSPSLISPPPKP